MFEQQCYVLVCFCCHSKLVNNMLMFDVSHCHNVYLYLYTLHFIHVFLIHVIGQFIYALASSEVEV